MVAKENSEQHWKLLPGTCVLVFSLPTTAAGNKFMEMVVLDPSTGKPAPCLVLVKANGISLLHQFSVSGRYPEWVERFFSMASRNNSAGKGKMPVPTTWTASKPAAPETLNTPTDGVMKVT